MRSPVTERLAIDFDDARGAITTEHREDFTDPLPREVGFAAPEEAGCDRFLAIQKEERRGIAALEVLFDAIGLVGVEERETRLTGDGVPKQRPELLVADQVDELVRVGERMAMVGRQQHKRVAGGS